MQSKGKDICMYTLKKDFLSPPDEFSPIPFWFWNDMPDKKELKRQLDDFYSKGIRGFVIHPRKGLPLSYRYLSDAFLDAVEYVVEEAYRLHMTVFLYDEAMYPSGAANGMVVNQNPAFAAKGLKMTKLDASEPTPAFGEGNWLVATVPAEGNIIYYFSLVYSEGTIRGVHEGEDDGEPNAPKAADLLDAEAMKLFIHLTHDTYYVRLQKYFGSTIVAMFTDEPSILGRCHKPDLIPWTHGFLQHYLACGGMLSDLPLLFEEETADNHRAHSVYRHAVNLWMAESYFKPISNWCREHGIALSGHPQNSDDIGFLKFFHIPCQDMVWRFLDPDKGNGLTGPHSTMGKCSSDSARHHNKRRNGNECFGACGRNDDPWNFTSDDMKWYLDWLFVRGVNLIIPHAFYFSLRDDRVNERPPDVGPNSIWWNHYEQIAAYIRRMCWLNTDSNNLTDIAVLCTEDHLPWKPVQALYQNQIEFNYLEAELLKECSLADDALEIGKQRYKVLLVEKGLLLTDSEKAYLQTCTEHGIKVIWVEEVPDNATLNILAQCNPLALKPTAPVKDLRITHIYKEDRHFYLMTNEGNDSLYFHAATIIKGQKELWDPWEGNFTPVADDEIIPIRLGYRESLILAVKPVQEISLDCSEGTVVCTEALDSKVRRFTTVFTMDTADTFSTIEVIHSGEIAALYIDGEKIGIKMWKPYRFRLPEKFMTGEHTITLEITDALIQNVPFRKPVITMCR